MDRGLRAGQANFDAAPGCHRNRNLAMVRPASYLVSSPSRPALPAAVSHGGIDELLRSRWQGSVHGRSHTAAGTDQGSLAGQLSSPTQGPGVTQDARLTDFLSCQSSSLAGR